MTQENQVPFRCEISTSDATVPLHLRVILDGQIILDQPHVKDTIPFECWIPDAEQQHVLVFELSGKTQEHTVVNDAGEIVKDAFLKLTNFSIDDIELNNIKTFEYEHDFNGTGEKTTDQFYDYMGCNGRVVVKFSTPIYLWLLENM